MHQNISNLAYISLQQIAIDMEFGIAPNEIGRIQRVLVDVTVGIDEINTQILDSEDGLKKGFDYSVIYDKVMAASITRPKLMETFANTVSNTVMELPKVQECVVTISKSYIWPNVPSTCLKIKRVKSI